MTMLSLSAAARATGLGKSTLTRAIKAGRLSATRTDLGSYQIDTAELFRVYTPAPQPPPDATGGATPATVHPATPDATAALLEAQIESLKTVGDMLRRQVDDLKSERDAWRETAQRLTIAPPAPARWWRWRRAG